MRGDNAQVIVVVNFTCRLYIRIGFLGTIEARAHTRLSINHGWPEWDFLKVVSAFLQHIGHIQTVPSKFSNARLPPAPALSPHHEEEGRGPHAERGAVTPRAAAACHLPAVAIAPPPGRGP